MLIDARQEENLVAPEPAVAGDHVGEDLFIGVADVGGAVGVVDGGGEVEHVKIRESEQWAGRRWGRESQTGPLVQGREVSA